MTLGKTNERTRARVNILLALYQGARYLRPQLDSYIAQDHQDWVLTVSDDGSTDFGPKILSGFQADHPHRRITRLHGPQRGFARNFLSLLQTVSEDIPYAALSDQDDVWLSDKLSRAIRALALVPAGQPALYCGRTLICDADLNTLGVSGVFSKPAAFRNALVQSIGGGNTMVLNRAALDLVALAAGEASDPVAHDWWLYQVITGCGGRIIIDPEPVLKYRQHGGNAIGANLSSAAQFLRVFALLNGRFRDWNEVGLAALRGPSYRFLPEARAVLQSYAAARSGSVWQRFARLRRSGVYRQGWAGTLALYLACLLNRL